jgi:hypothetical protein
VSLATSRTTRPIEPGATSIGWWGAVLGLIALAHLVGASHVATIYLRSRVETWPPDAIAPPGLDLSVWAAGLIVLAALLSGLATFRIGRARPFALPLLAVGAVLALVAAGLRAGTTILSDHPVTDDAYWSIRWFVGALDTILLLTAGGVLAFCAVHVARGVIVTGRHDECSIATLWTSVTAVFVVGSVVVQAATSVWWG